MIFPFASEEDISEYPALAKTPAVHGWRNLPGNGVATGDGENEARAGPGLTLGRRQRTCFGHSHTSTLSAQTHSEQQRSRLHRKYAELGA